MFKVQRIRNMVDEDIQKILNNKYKQGWEFITCQNNLLFFKRVNKPINNSSEDEKILSELDKL